jgi:hypothetical protein
VLQRLDVLTPLLGRDLLAPHSREPPNLSFFLQNIEKEIPSNRGNKTRIKQMSKQIKDEKRR